MKQIYNFECTDPPVLNENMPDNEAIMCSSKFMSLHLVHTPISSFSFIVSSSEAPRQPVPAG